jgi:hypothetical protein
MAMQTAHDNLVLRQLQSLLRDVAAVLESQERQQDLTARLCREVDEGFARLVRDICNIKSSLRAALALSRGSD